MGKFKDVVPVCIAALALTACNQSGPEDQAGNATGKAHDAAAETAFQMQPGRYRTTVTVESIEIPGMPAAMAEQMKAMMAKASAQESCVTPQRAAHGLDVVKEQMARGQCSYARFDTAEGKLAAAFTCQTGEGMAMTATSRGTYSGTGSTVKVDAALSGPQGKTMHVVQTVTTERIGDCT
ncbi:MAG: hypothetical protein RL268_396 [Pseudomonadota bacterium]|jgi:hypothetical protein